MQQQVLTADPRRLRNGVAESSMDSMQGSGVFTHLIHCLTGQMHTATDVGVEAKSSLCLPEHRTVHSGRNISR